MWARVGSLENTRIVGLTSWTSKYFKYTLNLSSLPWFYVSTSLLLFPLVQPVSSYQLSNRNGTCTRSFVFSKDCSLCLKWWTCKKYSCKTIFKLPQTQPLSVDLATARPIRYHRPRVPSSCSSRPDGLLSRCQELVDNLQIRCLEIRW